MSIEEKKKMAESIFLYYAAKINPGKALSEQKELLKHIDAILDMYLDYLKKNK